MGLSFRHNTAKEDEYIVFNNKYIEKELQQILKKDKITQQIDKGVVTVFYYISIWLLRVFYIKGHDRNMIRSDLRCRSQTSFEVIIRLNRSDFFDL